MSKEQRRYPRYRLLEGVPAAIESEGIRYIGLLQDISRNGVALRIMNRIHVSKHGTVSKDGTEHRATWEIYTPRGLHKTEGSIVRVTDSSVCMTFSNLLPQAFLKCLPVKGTVLWRKDEAWISGELGPWLRKDILAAAAFKKTLKFREVSGITGGGIALASLALERGSKIQDCPQHLRSIMEVSNICGHCRQANNVEQCHP